MKTFNLGSRSGSGWILTDGVAFAGGKLVGTGLHMCVGAEDTEDAEDAGDVEGVGGVEGAAGAEGVGCVGCSGGERQEETSG